MRQRIIIYDSDCTSRHSIRVSRFARELIKRITCQSAIISNVLYIHSCFSENISFDTELLYVKLHLTQLSFKLYSAIFHRILKHFLAPLHVGGFMVSTERDFSTRIKRKTKIFLLENFRDAPKIRFSWKKLHLNWMKFPLYM